jgi:hypothetical protein
MTTVITTKKHFFIFLSVTEVLSVKQIYEELLDRAEPRTLGHNQRRQHNSFVDAGTETSINFCSPEKAVRQ